MNRASRHWPALTALGLIYAGCSPAPASPSELETDSVVLHAVVADPPRGGNADGNPVYFQGHFGTQGNFELAVPAAGGGLLYYWRDNDHNVFWNGPDAVFTDAGHFDGLTMIESNYGTPGDLELAATRSGRLSFMYRDSDPVTPWHGPYDLGSDVAGTPSMIQSSSGKQGNFELVVPSASAGLVHYWRDNDNGMTWNGPINFFQNWGRFDAVSIIQTNYGGNLEGVARRGTQLYYFFHDTDWRGPWLIGSNCTGNPVMVQSRFGTQGNFEVAVPNVNAGVDYYWRDNDHGMVWSGPNTLFAGSGHVDGVGLFEGNYGTPGNMEMMLRQGQSLSFAFRNNQDPWSGPFAMSQGTDASFFAEPLAALRRGAISYLGMFSNNVLDHSPQAGILGTDLGVSFESTSGSLAFLFGDSWTPGGARQDWDSLATTNARFVDQFNMAPLTWVADSSGQFVAMDLPTIASRGMNVPLDAVAINGHHYVFFNSGWHTYCDNCAGEHGTLALGVMDGLAPSGLSTRFVVSSRRFTNLSAVVVGDWVYLYGAGEPYRFSPVYLARAPIGSLDDYTSWQYYRGVRNGIPVFGPGELTAVPLYRAGANWSDQSIPLSQRTSIGGVGELSVRMHAGNKMVLTYNALERMADGRVLRGIFMRTAPTPWGPWSAPEELIDANDAYGRWQHMSPSDNGKVVRPDDGLGEYARQDEWGGEYGPYLVPRWFTQNSATEFGLVFTLSSWNPYQAHLVRAVVTTDGHAVNLPGSGVGLPKAALVNGDFASGDTRGWTQTGDPFVVFRGSDGANRVRTYGAKGDATVGQLYQDVTIDSTTTQIAFKIHGGASQVRLRRNDSLDIVRAVHARNDNATELAVCWDVRDLQGRSVRIQIDDAETAPWGFIGVSGFRLLDASSSCR